MLGLSVPGSDVLDEISAEDASNLVRAQNHSYTLILHTVAVSVL